MDSFTHNPLISKMSPKEDSERFSVNCSFYIPLDASSPSAGLCGDSRPHRDQDVPQRHRPSCQCSREIAVTHTGQENRTGGNRGGQVKEEVEGEGSRLAIFKSRLSSAEEALAAAGAAKLTASTHPSPVNSLSLMGTGFPSILKFYMDSPCQFRMK